MSQPSPPFSYYMTIARYPNLMAVLASMTPPGVKEMEALRPKSWEEVKNAAHTGNKPRGE